MDTTMDDQPPMTTMTLTTSQKRPLDDDVPVSTPQRIAAPRSDTDGSPLTILSSIRTPSPLRDSAPSASTLQLGGSLAVAGHVTAAPPAASGPQASKKRKVDDKEKEAKRLEREAKDKIKAEQKAQRDEEKRIKDEEKRVRDEEKRKKNEEKEEKKRAKELEQQQKEHEKLKKERLQPKLNAFFVKKKTDGDVSRTAAVDAIQNPTAEPVSIPPDVIMQDADPGPVSPQKALKQSASNDYDRFFLPFQLPTNAILAPINRIMEDPMKVALARSRLDQLLAGENVTMDPIDIQSYKCMLPQVISRGRKTASIAEIAERLNNNSPAHPIDLTKEDGIGSQDPTQLLKQIPMKYLHFSEDVRPPYYGTYTKPHTSQEAAKLARNPVSRTLKDINYDYDSEAEWEEPAEGDEDLDSDGDEDMDEEGEDDMDGFLDDEDDAQIKRRLINGDLQPVSTGLCWEDAKGVSILNDGSGAISTEFKGFRMGFLLEPQPRSIDPFSTTYWTPTPPPVVIAPVIPGSDGTLNGAMQPPRLPLTQRPMNSMLNSLNNPGANSTAPNVGSKPPKPPKRLIPADAIPEFKLQVEGSDLTKIALIEALKKKFPKFPKDAISNTLSTVAARVGVKEVDKRWVLL